jgi:hypothetical protein
MPSPGNFGGQDVTQDHSKVLPAFAAPSLQPEGSLLHAATPAAAASPPTKCLRFMPVPVLKEMGIQSIGYSNLSQCAPWPEPAVDINPTESPIVIKNDLLKPTLNIILECGYWFFIFGDL